MSLSEGRAWNCTCKHSERVHIVVGGNWPNERVVCQTCQHAGKPNAEHAFRSRMDRLIERRAKGDRR